MAIDVLWTTPDRRLTGNQGELDIPLRSAPVLGGARRRVARRTCQPRRVETQSLEGMLSQQCLVYAWRRPAAHVILDGPGAPVGHTMLASVALGARCAVDEMDAATGWHGP